MKFIPILFSTPMVQAILEGRKTMTRRIVNPQPSEKIKWDNFGFSALTPAGHIEGRGQFPEGYGSKFFKCPYGQPGDVLWVRESCTYVIRDHAHDLLEGSRDGVQWVYKSSMHEDWMKYAKEKYGYKWKPSIHMPKEACRLFLRITNIRVERLKDITDQDAIAEGIEGYFEKLFMEWRYRDYDKKLQKGYGKSNIDYPTWREQVSSFKSLWESINGKESWEANPWVWVVKFEKMEGRPDGF